MTRTTITKISVASVPGTDIELSLGYATGQDESDMFFHVAKDRIIVGYLVHDDDCSDPMENDGMGKVFSSSRRATKESRGGFCKALGLNEDFQPNTNLVDDDKVMKFLAEETILSFKGEKESDLYKLLKEYFDDVCTRSEEENDLEFVMRSLEHSGLDDLSEFIDFDPFTLAAWTEGRLKGKIGSKYAVMLDVYEHGGVSYRISGEGTQCIFDTAKGGAVWVAQPCDIQNFEDKTLTYEENFKKAKEYARGCVEEYTKWCNGECYGYVIESHSLNEEGEAVGDDAENLDTCWGYIGADYAKEACKEAFDYQVKEMK